jgi:ribosome-associated heat shock protein Hsp15
MAASQRLDKWLWCARFFKTRALAAKFCDDGRLRIAGQITRKAHYAVRPGDVLTFPLGPHIRVIKITELASRRGPPAEARLLYEDLAPPQTGAPSDRGAPLDEPRDEAASTAADPAEGSRL